MNMPHQQAARGRSWTQIAKSLRCTPQEARRAAEAKRMPLPAAARDMMAARSAHRARAWIAAGRRATHHTAKGRP